MDIGEILPNQLRWIIFGCRSRVKRMPFTDHTELGSVHNFTNTSSTAFIYPSLYLLDQEFAQNTVSPPFLATQACQTLL